MFEFSSPSRLGDGLEQVVKFDTFREKLPHRFVQYLKATTANSFVRLSNCVLNSKFVINPSQLKHAQLTNSNTPSTSFQALAPSRMQGNSDLGQICQFLPSSDTVYFTIFTAVKSKKCLSYRVKRVCNISRTRTAQRSIAKGSSRLTNTGWVRLTSPT